VLAQCNTFAVFFGLMILSASLHRLAAFLYGVAKAVSCYEKGVSLVHEIAPTEHRSVGLTCLTIQFLLQI
jgi:hypothetical protein